ncbi:hypothetical protein DES53_107267 [Roseimicrobium gellanilyticum]|uniref:Uncharacterized protein n=1 Tax=Roseimicrobium gellanilyticum TaxID=748857 RepID=A0A366HHX5_9BACT|nr:hypothetical protein [Roseimicrobium gellanilyticum]RBP41435.1 hypothetical protein DES53_107267 [Roseimicrobium gellanilyticum]
MEPIIYCVGAAAVICALVMLLYSRTAKALEALHVELASNAERQIAEQQQGTHDLAASLSSTLSEVLARIQEHQESSTSRLSQEIQGLLVKTSSDAQDLLGDSKQRSQAHLQGMADATGRTSDLLKKVLEAVTKSKEDILEKVEAEGEQMHAEIKSVLQKMDEPITL